MNPSALPIGIAEKNTARTRPFRACGVMSSMIVGESAA